MSLKLVDRDYVPDGNGGVASGRGGEELLDEALFRLAARRGSFPFLPRLGSRMDQLRRAKPSDWESLALQYAVEALEGLDGVSVAGIRVSREQDGLWAAAELLWQGERLTVTARLEE